MPGKPLMQNRSQIMDFLLDFSECTIIMRSVISIITINMAIVKKVENMTANFSILQILLHKNWHLK